MANGDINLPNQTGKVDPRLTVSRPANPVRRPPVADKKTTAARRIQQSLGSLIGKR